MRTETIVSEHDFKLGRFQYLQDSVAAPGLLAPDVLLARAL